MLIAGWSLLFFGESLGALAWTGIAISVLGLVAMALMARGNDESKALPWTLLAMLAMTGRLRRSAGRWMPRARPGAMALLVGSLCVGLAYALVIHAMRTLPAAEVVAYTNTGIVLATVMSLLVFRERLLWRQRAVAAGVVCAGLACIGVGRAL